jgi:replicative DNA helicase
MSQDRFTQYGKTFQLKIIAALLKDKTFLQQIYDILIPEYFDSEANVWIVDTIMKYYPEYKQVPTLEVFKVKALELTNETLKLSIVESLKDILRYVEAEDLEFVKGECINFCKNQCIKKAIIESVDLLKTGAYDNIKKKIDSAMKAGANQDIGLEYLKDVKLRYEESARITIPSPWPAFNELVDGGIGKGELIIFVAGPGAGKSTSMINVGAHLLKLGKTVVHYTMELSEPYVAQRYDSVVTGIATANLKYNLDEVEHELSKLKGQLYLKFFPTKTASVTTLKAHLDKMIMQGVKPDVVIVDYADLLRSAKAKEKLHEELETTYEDLRGLAGEYQLPVITASQANRSSVESDIITSDQVASSFSKIMIGDVIISLARKTTDKIAGTGRVHFIKNRFGPDGLTLPTKLNMSNGRIDMYQETSIKGRETKTEMDEDTVTRKSLATKYSELLGDSLG